MTQSAIFLAPAAPDLVTVRTFSVTAGQVLVGRGKVKFFV
jgi:hypothetical protein